jgi:hypothetical protein
MYTKVIDWLLAHRPVLVMLCIAAVILTSMLVDYILGKMDVSFRLDLPIRIMAILSLVLVTIAFFTVVAVTSILFKIRGRSPLSLVSQATGTTYWTERGQSDPTLEYLKRQF